jgi:hypothetical protein
MLRRFWTFASDVAGAVTSVAAIAAVAVLGARPEAAADIEPDQHMQPASPSVDGHWTSAADSVSAAFAGIGRMESLHAAALSQLDAADYAIGRIIEELSVAMPILPADGSALRALLATVEEDEALADQPTLAA